MKTVEPWKVLHGKNALPGEVPWNIEIYYHYNFYQRCGGTLISASKILSAAHCFHRELKKSEIAIPITSISRNIKQWLD